MNKADRIKGITKETDYRFLNFYKMDVCHKNGQSSEYYMASRAKSPEALKAVSHVINSDGVAIYAVCGEKKDQVVLVRQYRYPLGDYIYEFPAGLVEAGESAQTAAVREFREETGMTLQVKPAAEAYTKPRFTTIGMTDEACSMIYGFAKGRPDASGQEASEDIQVIIADRTEVKRILEEENVAIMCAYMLMHFLAAKDDPFAFLQE